MGLSPHADAEADAEADADADVCPWGGPLFAQESCKLVLRTSRAITMMLNCEAHERSVN